MRWFQPHLAQFGIKIRPIVMDGNCFFRAIADQLVGDEEHHLLYRKRAVDHMSKNEQLYKFFVEDDEPFADYVKRMRQPGQWAGQLEIKAVCELQRVNLMVH